MDTGIVVISKTDNNLCLVELAIQRQKPDNKLNQSVNCMLGGDKYYGKKKKQKSRLKGNRDWGGVEKYYFIGSGQKRTQG